MHNGHWGDRGTTACDIELRRAGKAVWSQKNVPVAWSATEEPPTEIPLPTVAFDTLHLDITAWSGWGAGLREIEVIKGTQEPGCRCNRHGQRRA